MDKSAIKKFAVEARSEMIKRVALRAKWFGITPESTGDPNAETVNGHILSQTEFQQRLALIENIKQQGYDQVIEEVAYTWFNRFIALRFMEVNGYLPSHVRVFTNAAGEFKPQILDEAIHLKMKGLDSEKVLKLKDANQNEELFKYLLTILCNALNSILPGMFQKINDYTELLFPDNLLRAGSPVEKMVTAIPEEDWKDQVQIIGWLYQFYISEQNELVYDGSFSKKRIPKELLPAATTIYTPDWPVRYMVENSLGRLWQGGHPNEALKAKWEYYLDEATQESEIETKLMDVQKEYANLTPEEILVIDPCVGSGHILCVLFDTLVQIYEDYGYSAREAAAKIVEKNLWGLDIDERAAQLAYFAVMMKGRQYDGRFFDRKVQPHVYVINETNALRPDYEAAKRDIFLPKEHQETLDYLMGAFMDAKEYGSILQLENRDYVGLKESWLSADAKGVKPTLWVDNITEPVTHLIDQAIALSQKYHVVVTNPPYLGKSRFSPKLDEYIKSYYPDEKADLSMAVYRQAIDNFARKNGFIAFITTSSWMSLSSFSKLRNRILETTTISSIVDFGTELFDGKVGHNQIVSWVVSKNKLEKQLIAIRLVDYCYSRRYEKREQFFNHKNRYTVLQNSFEKILGSPIAYWVSEQLLDAFVKCEVVKDYADVRSGMSTTDNARFLRLWFEEDVNNIKFDCLSLDEASESEQKWYPYNKGGDYRKWYGNNEYVVNWLNDGAEIKYWVTHNPKDPKTTSWGRRIFATDCFFKSGITWSSVTVGAFSCRLYETGFIFDSGANGLFASDESNRYYIAGLLNSKVGSVILKIINPTINSGPGSIGRIPVIIDNHTRVTSLVKDNRDISKQDWDSFETSWDFQHHPLTCRNVSSIGDAFVKWETECSERFANLKSKEEELNQIFINIYGLQDELTPEVENKGVSVRKADLKRDIRSFISYAVGCMFGRYSLDQPGLAYAGGEWDAAKYKTFLPDKDNIIPVCDDEYFTDDIVGRFIQFVELVFGKETLEGNLRFIADGLGGRGVAREVIRHYFLNNFFTDHCKIYQKRPIYWLFDSGELNGFKCLVYLHRYQPDTLARIRTDYIHPQQSRYRSALADLDNRIADAQTPQRAELVDERAKLQDQADELLAYEAKIHHLANQMIEIDLDDGVKVNYAKFQDVLAKIK